MAPHGCLKPVHTSTWPRQSWLLWSPALLEIAAATRTKSLIRAFPNLSLITSDYRSARSAPDLVAAGKESLLLSSVGNPDARVS